MNVSSAVLKTLFASAAAAASIGVAMAQGVPPNPDVANPAIGAGQRSLENTPKGVTGTPTGKADLNRSDANQASQADLQTNTQNNTRALGAGTLPNDRATTDNTLSGQEGGRATLPQAMEPRSRAARH